MTARLHLLVVEDGAPDAELTAAQLTKNGFELEWLRVESEPELRQALTEPWDLIITDYDLRSFDALAVIAIVRELVGVAIPIIVVTGAASEEDAVKCIRAGAEDYLWKDRPARLTSAVRQALERHHLAEAHHQARDELEASEQRFQALVEAMQDVVYTLDPDGRFTGIYGQWLKREGLAPELFLGRTGAEIFGPGGVDHSDAIRQALLGQPAISQWSFMGSNGARDFQTSFSRLRNGAGAVTGVVASARELTSYRQAIDELSRLQRQVIERLLIAVEFRDAETGQHTARMGALCSKLAAHMGIDEQVCRSIELAAPMHDVGKIGLPDSVLLKPGKLTADERAIVETHAEIGHRMLSGSGIELLDLAAEIALTHHEHYDGTGYPRGLAGDDIPIAGRLAAVADVFDALTSHRVYRPAFPVLTALEMMREETGRHFDRAVLDALFALQPEHSSTLAGARAGERRSHHRPAIRRRDADELNAALAGGHCRTTLVPVSDLTSSAVFLWRLGVSASASLGPEATRELAAAHGMRRRLDRCALRSAFAHLAPGRQRVLVGASVRSVIEPWFGEEVRGQAVSPGSLVVALEGPNLAAVESLTPALDELRGWGCLISLEGFGQAEAGVDLACRTRVDYLTLSPRLWARVEVSPQQQLTVKSFAGLADGLGARLIVGPIRTAGELETLRLLGVDAGFGPALGLEPIELEPVGLEPVQAGALATVAYSREAA